MDKNMTIDQYLNYLLTTDTNEHCPVRKTLELLSGKWRTHVIYELCKKETCRFGELKKAIPQITNTMLTATLRDLENKKIVSRKQFNEIPPHVEYSLTKKGKDLLPIFYEIAKWGIRYIDE
ncbi:MAG: winged helix-turn-helix transcriptional regulator [Faecalibacillus sp.]